MDVSDLPVPLSRIEKLWNCLITGETPDFEPLSRNEKYLMAMLNYYDISNLPTPMSRGEKLLYKLAIGETDLSDIPGYLSRYEELLKYLIENGEISGGDFEYVLYTLNQSLYTLYTTAEKPVKSAILKGQTLVNVNRSNYTTNTNITTDYEQAIEFYDADMLPNTTYTIITYSDNPYECRFSQMYNDREYALGVVKVGTPFVFTTAGNYQGLRSYLKGDELNIPQGTEIKILIIEGDYTNIDIPYFEGMQSVKMPVLTTTGKNLVHIPSSYNNKFFNELSPGEYKLLKDYHREYSGVNLLSRSIYQPIVISYTVKTEESDKPFFLRVQYTDDTVEYSNVNTTEYSSRTWNISKPIKSLRIVGGSNGASTWYIKDLQVELGTQATSYEPYKSNILSTPSDLELCGIGDVKDELDLITGELTQRIGECSLDGSSNSGKWVIRTDVYMEGYIYFQQELNYIIQSENIAICDRLPYSNQSRISSEQLRLSAYNNGTIIGVRLSESKGVSNLDEFSEYLKSNPIKFKYPLATESIKTVDLTVVDQDNQPTELGTFENVTHVSLEAENLIPEVEMEVATRISEELASANPLMDDISTEQQQLETTVDEQSNNVDATMIATTEIYEETL